MWEDERTQSLLLLEEPGTASRLSGHLGPLLVSSMPPYTAWLLWTLGNYLLNELKSLLAMLGQCPKRKHDENLPAIFSKKCVYLQARS